MKISKIVFENFKPYYNPVEFDLSVNPEKNIILIGGRNGQGKTSFLLGAVWCLYGQNIDKVDDVFKKEIKGSYPKFLKNALNWEAHNEGRSTFSVKITFTDVELSDGLKQEQLTSTVDIIRSYNIDENVDGETFEIFIDGQKNGLISDETDKINFINDYLIPIEIAKFVFFDAEKIADLASLGAKDQALIINQAFNQILGLSNYENLVDDLEEFEKELSKREAKGELMLQISSFENGISHNRTLIEKYQDEVIEIDEEILLKDKNLREVIDLLYKRGDVSLKTNLDELKKRKDRLGESLENVKAKFNEASELIAFAIMAPLLQESYDHIKREQELDKKNYQDEDLQEKTKELAERLFNKPPFPDKDLEMDVKVFYYNKAKQILASIIKDEKEEAETLSFKHELDRSEALQVSKVLDLTNSYSKDSFESVFSEYIKVQNDFQEASAELKKIETLNQDEFIGELQIQKNKLEQEKSLLEQKKGAKANEILKLTEENKRNTELLKNKIEKVGVSKQTENQKKIVNNYIKTLNQFIQIQKQQKKENLQNNLLLELKRILDKPNLINEVEINILSNNLGLEIKLYNKDKRETNPSTDLSKGEQQLYISALLKAILAESVYDLPVFIDTPLGRLDQEHRDAILSKYYPELSEQVIILSTNTEVRASDLPKIENHIAKTYRLKNNNNKTELSTNYFTTQ